MGAGQVSNGLLEVVSKVRFLRRADPFSKEGKISPGGRGDDIGFNASFAAIADPEASSRIV